MFAGMVTAMMALMSSSACAQEVGGNQETTASAAALFPWSSEAVISETSAAGMDR